MSNTNNRMNNMENQTSKLLTSYKYRNEWRNKSLTIREIHQVIRDGKYARRVSAVRGEEDIRTEYGVTNGPVAAEDLPVVYPSRNEHDGYTGLVLLSVRVEERLDRLERLRQMVNRWPQTLLTFLGTSGQSLKILMPYLLPDGTLPVGEQQVQLFRQYAFRRAADYLAAATGMKADETMADGSEHFRISSDDRAFLNTAVQPILMEQPTEQLTEQTADQLYHSEQNPMEAEVLPGYTKQEMDITKFNMLCRKLSFERRRTPDEYLLHIADECRKAGIDQEVATKCILWQGSYWDKDTLVRSCVENAYNGHRLGMQNPIERSLMYQQLLEEFLHRRYLFRKNRVTGDMEVMEKDRYILSWQPLTQEVRNDINNAAIREGIKVWPQDLERIIVSRQTSEYDPVKEWLDQLPRWDGRDRLGELAARVPTRMPDWDGNFRVWMRSMVNQWLSATDSMYGAQMVLMLVGAQGTRKSTFLRMLLPRQLRTFYIDRIDFTNKKEALRALSRFLLINIDEYDQISKAQTAFLKHLIQRTDVKERKMYETTYQQQQRYAAFCATTNSLTPLKDESGSRRYMVVEVGGLIDTDTQGERAIDYPQLYAQIVSDIQKGEACYFDGDRERQIQEYNGDYYETPNVVSMFDDLYRQPQAGDEVLRLSPTQILQQIKDRLKVNVVSQANATILGSYLRRQHYKKHYRTYEVALKQ